MESYTVVKQYLREVLYRACRIETALDRGVVDWKDVREEALELLTEAQNLYDVTQTDYSLDSPAG